MFVDPPYDTAAGEVASVLEALAAADAGRRARRSWWSVAESATARLPDRGWQIEKERSYGDTLIVVATA